jgi:putative transport protein
MSHALVVDLLRAEPLLLLFAVAAVGYLVGRVSVFGVRLGVAAVLFVGLGFGALDPALELPEVVTLLGLLLFVYTIGLSSGQQFFASLRRRGVRDNLFVVLVLLAAAVAAVAGGRTLGIEAGRAAGVYCGALTNTPALATVVQTIRTRHPEGSAREAALALPVVGYSIAYPAGVLGMIAALGVARRLVGPRDPHDAPADAAPRARPSGSLTARTIEVTNPLIIGFGPDEVAEHSGIDVVFGRMRRDGVTTLASSATRFRLGDVVSVVGPRDQIDRMTTFVGRDVPARIELDRGDLDSRGMFVSDPRVAGHTLAELDLVQHFGAVVTRLRRGDVELVPHGGTVLELGDRVRVLAPPDHLDAVARFLGDSYRRVSEVDVLSLGLGVALGLLLGLIPIPLPGGLTVRLGLAGGPLVVSLILGSLVRTGPLTWNLPYGANLTLRQFGLTLFLAGVGTRSGYEFAATLAGGDAWPMLGLAVGLTALAALATLGIGHRVLKIPLARLAGMLAAVQTQPALLAYAQEQWRDDRPNVVYATVYPAAMIVKIVLAQVVLGVG